MGGVGNYNHLGMGLLPKDSKLRFLATCFCGSTGCEFCGVARLTWRGSRRIRKNRQQGRFDGVETFFFEHHRLVRIPVPKPLADPPVLTDAKILAHLRFGMMPPK